MQNDTASQPAPSVPWYRAPWFCGHNDPVYAGEHAQSCATCGVIRHEPGHTPATLHDADGRWRGRTLFGVTDREICDFVDEAIMSGDMADVALGSLAFYGCALVVATGMEPSAERVAGNRLLQNAARAQVARIIRERADADADFCGCMGDRCRCAKGGR